MLEKKKKSWTGTMAPSYQVVVKVTLNECAGTGQLITCRGFVGHAEGLSLPRGPSIKYSAGYTGVNR